jgi:hypothetical protein
MKLSEVNEILKKMDNEKIEFCPLVVSRKIPVREICMKILGFDCEIANGIETPDGFRYVVFATRKVFIKMKRILEEGEE